MPEHFYGVHIKMYLLYVVLELLYGVHFKCNYCTVLDHFYGVHLKIDLIIIIKIKEIINALA